MLKRFTYLNLWISTAGLVNSENIYMHLCIMYKKQNSFQKLPKRVSECTNWHYFFQNFLSFVLPSPATSLCVFLQNQKATLYEHNA